MIGTGYLAFFCHFEIDNYSHLAEEVTRSTIKVSKVPESFNGCFLDLLICKHFY